jgi:hypothetical protein
LFGQHTRRPLHQISPRRRCPPLRHPLTVTPDRRPPRPTPPNRHPELGSGSIYQPKTSVCVARWMPNHVVLCTPSAPA